MTDPISDFLTRLRNASKAKLEECVMPHSTVKEGIANILRTEGYVSEVNSGNDAAGHKTLIVKMKYVDGAPAITGSHAFRRPVAAFTLATLKFRASSRPRHQHRLDSKGLMKDSDCRRNKAGGELLCNIW